MGMEGPRKLQQTDQKMKLLNSDTNSAYSRAVTAQRYLLCHVTLGADLNVCRKTDAESTDSASDDQQLIKLD